MGVVNYLSILLIITLWVLGSCYALDGDAKTLPKGDVDPPIPNGDAIFRSARCSGSIGRIPEYLNYGLVIAIVVLLHTTVCKTGKDRLRFIRYAGFVSIGRATFNHVAFERSFADSTFWAFLTSLWLLLVGYQQCC